MTTDRSIVRVWSRRQSRLGRRQAMPTILLGLAATGLAAGQAWCIATVLAHALLRGIGAAAADLPAIAAFAVLALLRALLLAAGDGRAAAGSGASRRRLRAEALSAILAQGPALLRRQPTGVLGALVVDRIEALDGFFGRWIPAATLALASPALILAVACAVQPRAALVLLACGLAVPVSQAAFGIGAAVAARRQFVAMGRLQARFLDRVRGIATIVLAGRADDEALRTGTAADELRRLTMRVLRVAFLSSAALDCAFAVALVLVALLDGHVLLHHGAGVPGDAALLRRSLFALLLVPEFFQPLRAFALAYQDRMQAAGAADAFHALSPRRRQLPPARPCRCARSAAHGVSPGVRACRLRLGRVARAGPRRRQLPHPGAGRDGCAGRSVGQPASPPSSRCCWASSPRSTAAASP